MLCFFEYLGRIVQVMRSEIFDMCVLFFLGGGSRFENGSFEPEIWFEIYQRVFYEEIHAFLQKKTTYSEISKISI